jgi:hypothetical protein
MAPVRPLAPDSGITQLTSWLTEWSLCYPFAYDEMLKPVLRPANRHFTTDELEVILRWKLGQRWQKKATADVNAYAQSHPSSVPNETGNALNAPTDLAAMEFLVGIPWVQGPAVGSAVLMTLDPDRWTVFDVQASAALVCLRDLLTDRREDSNDCLYQLAELLAQFNPQRVRGQFPAAANDWPMYMAVCREISRITMLSLRTIDRALYEARGWC